MLEPERITWALARLGGGILSFTRPTRLAAIIGFDGTPLDGQGAQRVHEILAENLLREEPANGLPC